MAEQPGFSMAMTISALPKPDLTEEDYSDLAGLVRQEGREPLGHHVVAVCTSRQTAAGGAIHAPRSRIP
jgi:hypothetical protein